MSRIYEREELIRLRESPLVKKKGTLPASLPPIEEWMGPPIDPAQSNQNQGRGSRTIGRGRNEEASTSETPTPRRPAYEARVRNSGVNEDIILGPPKTSFASTGRKSGHALEGHQRSGSMNHGEDDRTHDSNYHKEKSSKDTHRHERNGEQTRDSRQSTGARPRSDKIDSEMWATVRQSRTGDLENDRSQKRNGEREHDRERRDDPSGGGRDGGRYANNDNSDRRAWQPRGRNEPSWMRDGDNKDVERNGGDYTRSRGWRDDQHKGTRNTIGTSDRGGRHETDPEWMAGPEPESTEKPTADDLQAWMARMKAGSGSAPQPPGDRTDGSSIPGEVVVIPPSSTAKTKESKPLVLERSYDGFFGLLDKPRNTLASTGEQDFGKPPVPASTTAKSSKFSKFSSMFGPPPQAVEPVPEAAPSIPSPPANDSSDADKAGFARILTMLGNKQQLSAENTNPQRPDSRQVPPSTGPSQSPESGQNKGPFAAFGGPRSPPAHIRPKTNDSQFLLNLMQQPRKPPPDSSTQQGGPHDKFNGPAGLPMSNLMISPHEQRQPLQSATPSSGPYHDEGPPRDKLNPNAGTDRRPPPGFPEAPLNFNPQRPSQQLPGFPPGMQRPPGFEHLPLGHTQQQWQPPPPQPQRQSTGPPPGFQGPPGRQNAFPPGLLPNGQSDRGGPQFGPRPNGPGMPPPGFHMSINGPPPGFPSVPFGQDGLPFGPGYGDFGQAAPGFGGPIRR